MGDGKERDETCRDFPYPGVRIEGNVEDEVSRLVQTQPDRGTGKKPEDVAGLPVAQKDVAYVSFVMGRRASACWG